MPPSADHAAAARFHLLHRAIILRGLQRYVRCRVLNPLPKEMVIPKLTPICQLDTEFLLQVPKTPAELNYQQLDPEQKKLLAPI